MSPFAKLKLAHSESFNIKEVLPQYNKRALTTSLVNQTIEPLITYSLRHSSNPSNSAQMNEIEFPPLPKLKNRRPFLEIPRLMAYKSTSSCNVQMNALGEF